jgi:hypothetical protein
LIRAHRVAILAAAALLVVIVGSVLATPRPAGEDPNGPLAASHEPEASEPGEAPPSAEDVAHAAERLQAHGIDAGTDLVADLAARYGVGGAVRVLAWADATGMTTDEIAALRDAGDGWGRIAHELGVSPGIGSIMGNAGGNGHGLGRDEAPGQQDD